MYGKTLSEETKAKLSAAFKGKNSPRYGKGKTLGAGKLSQIISVFDVINNNTYEYDSISEAAKAIGVSQGGISQYLALGQQKPYKKRYIIRKKI